MKQCKSVWVILLLFALVATHATGEEKKFSKTLRVAEGGTLTLSSDVGSVSVRGTTSANVVVEATISGVEGSIDAFSIAEATEGSNVVVSGKYNAPNIGRLAAGMALKVSFSIEVPTRYNLVVTTSGGSIYLENIEGTEEVKTSGGEITAKNIDGSLTCVTSAGSIDAEKIAGALRGTTSGGSVRVSVVRDYKGIYTKTSGGSIVIALPRSATATIDATTSGGKVTCDLPVVISERTKEKVLRGTLNGGGDTLFAKTSAGSISIIAVD